MSDARFYILSAVVGWFYRTPQPDGAILMPHGVTIHDPAHNRVYGLRPRGWENRAILVVGVATLDWAGAHPVRELTNPLRRGEVDDITFELENLGEKVIRSWTSLNRDTACLALEKPVLDSLAEAVDRFEAGCQGHTTASKMCDCGWYGKGRALIIPPEVRR